MLRSPLNRVAAWVLILLLGATATGLPSHHHETHQGGPAVVDAGHHGHGVVLLDAAERLVTQAGHAALPERSMSGMPHIALRVMRLGVQPSVRPSDGRPPPSSRPRAPPVQG